ncbi:hypothetical protein IWQ61_004703 [Dispira simplex]|nr:hypothetical protein IWQ61_004703 [Dispira simplex]
MREPTLTKGVPRAKQRPNGTVTGNTNSPNTPCPTTKKRTRILTPGDTRINSPMAALRKDELIRQLMEIQQENVALTEQLRETNEQLHKTRDQLKETREQVQAIQNNREETTKHVPDMSDNPNTIAGQHNNKLTNQPTAVNTGEQPIETTTTRNPDHAGTPLVTEGTQPPLTYRTWADVIRGATPEKRRLLREVIPAPKQDLTTIVVIGVTGRISAIKGLLTECGLQKPFPLNIETLHDNMVLMFYPTSMENDLTMAMNTGIIGHRRVTLQQASSLPSTHWPPQLKKAIGTRLSKRIAEFWYRRPVLRTQITQWMETLTLPTLSNDEMIEHARMTRTKRNPRTKKSPRAQPLPNRETQIPPRSQQPSEETRDPEIAAPPIN